MQLEAMIDQDMEEHIAVHNLQAVDSEAIHRVVGAMGAIDTLCIGQCVIGGA